MESPKFPPTSL